MGKGILTRIRDNWKAKTTEEKIELMLDVVCSLGGGLGASIVGKRLCFGQNKIVTILVRTTMTGLGIAAGDVATTALMDNYGKPMAAICDSLQKMKGETAHE